MKVFTNNTFKGHWPVGTAAVVVANTQEEAAAWLEEELRKRGLMQSINNSDLIEVDTEGFPKVIILNDGNY